MQNQEISLSGLGSHSFTTPSFIPANPYPDQCLWWRITLSDTKALSADGSGTAHGYQFGETEDYYLCPHSPRPRDIYRYRHRHRRHATATPTATAPVTSTLYAWIRRRPIWTPGGRWTKRAAPPPTISPSSPTNGTLFDGPMWVPGMVAGALSFDGVDDYVEVADDASLNFGLGNLTIDAWIKTSDIGDVRILVDKRGIVGPAIQQIGGYLLFLNKGGWAFNWPIGRPPTTSRPRSSPTGTGITSPSRWIETARPAASSTWTAPRCPALRCLRSDEPSRLADERQPTADGQELTPVPYIAGFYDGILDEVELFPRVLDAAEIHDIFCFGSGGKCKCVDRPPDMERLVPVG